MFNSNQATMPTTITNHEGAPAFLRSDREQVLQALMIGNFGNTFYATKQSIDEQFMETVLKARDEDPEFLAKALVYARNSGLIKDTNTKGLAVLAGGRGKTRASFDAIFGRVINIPDDLRKFAELCVSGAIPGKKGLGGFTKVAVAGWLGNISEYHALKYGSAASKGMTLGDIIRMSHPRPASAEVAERLGWLVKGSKALGSDPTLNPQIRAFEALKVATTEEEIVALIRQGRLPYEVVVPTVKVTTPAIWGELLKQAPYMNLLRALATFTRHDVFNDEDNVRYAAAKLSDPDAVRRSKVLPFRFFDAWRTYCDSERCDSRIADALRAAANISFDNLPSFGGRTVAIAPDVSGSMGCTFGNGSTRYIDIAGVFCGALLRQIGERAITLPFEHRVIDSCGLSGRDDVLVTADKLARIGGGGTSIGAPIERLLSRKTKVDVFIGITDNVDWAYGENSWFGSGRSNSSFLDAWRRYRAEVNPEAQAFLITIAPYQETVAPVGEPGVHFIYGWSDSVLKYIMLKLEGGPGQVQEVSRMSLSELGNRTVTQDHAQNVYGHPSEVKGGMATLAELAGIKFRESDD